jgi:uncharacterized protein (DUF1800 family)
LHRHLSGARKLRYFATAPHDRLTDFPRTGAFEDFDMSLDAKGAAALALHRFGFGPRAGSIDAIASDPRGALLAELDKPGIGQIVNAELMTAAQSSTAAFNFRQERQARLIAQKQAEDERKASLENKAAGNAMEGMEKPEGTAQPAPEPQPNVQQQIYFREVKARLDAALEPQIGFVERLIWFWSNHFCISADLVQSMAGGYEREAIRPHVLGRFADMLLACEGHPAMLFYLDNSRSIGPKSVAGLVNTRGLNENLAREILELHTLGVRSVYSQDDVTSFAKVLTGWTIIPAATNPQHGGEFVFNPRMHEPGPQTVVGKVYAQSDAAQGRAVLADLARHPATAAHVARKLARHFSADDPPPALVERLERRFLDTDGDLKELAKTLIAAPETWDAQRGKLKRPSEWLISGWRGLGVAPDAQRALAAMAYLGERMWRPNAPQGFPDVQAAWIDGLAQRLDIANRIAELVQERIEPAQFIDTALGPLASDETRKTIARAESRQQGLTLALMAPEFQRR